MLRASYKRILAHFLARKMRKQQHFSTLLSGIGISLCQHLFSPLMREHYKHVLAKEDAAAACKTCIPPGSATGG